MSSDITVDIVKHIGVIKTNGNNWTKELNIVSWNGGAPKYDIREWSPDHTRMTRGITLTADEIKDLVGFYSQHENSGK